MKKIYINESREDRLKRLAMKRRQYKLDYPERVRKSDHKFRQNNTDKVRMKTREWQSQNQDKMRVYNWRAQGIDITYTQYQEILSQQGSRCAICKIHESKLTKSLCVDHDHNTGRVRGLLCQTCNDGIGRFDDNIELLKVAIDYLMTDSLVSVNI